MSASKSTLRIIFSLCFTTGIVFSNSFDTNVSGGGLVAAALGNNEIFDYYELVDGDENLQRESDYPQMIIDVKNKREPWFYPLRSINRKIFNQVDAELGKRTNDGGHYDNYDNIVGVDYRDENNGRHTNGFNDYGNFPTGKLTGDGGNSISSDSSSGSLSGIVESAGSFSSGHGLSSNIGRTGGQTAKQLNKPGSPPLLSITAPLDVLKQKVAIAAAARKVERNRQLMDRNGKRSVVSYYPTTAYKDKFYPRKSETLFL